uniref:Uncharacterized protein n=1 Tax=Babesia rodhaini TaxID=5870 RepID=A0A455R101_BABRO|nr:hypothetical protein [Babesia rodhaini]
MKKCIKEKDYCNIIKNNIILKLFCKKIQFKGNYFSIKKEFIKYIYNYNLINFNYIFSINIINIFYILKKLVIKYEKYDDSLNIFNMRSIIYIIRIVFKIIKKNIKINKNNINLRDYLYYNKFNDLLNNIKNNKNKLLYKFFFKDYLDYIELFKDKDLLNLYYYKNFYNNSILKKYNYIYIIKHFKKEHYKYYNNYFNLL